MRGNALTVVRGEGEKMSLFSSFPGENIQRLDLKVSPRHEEGRSEQMADVAVLEQRLIPTELHPVQVLSRLALTGPELVFRDHFTVNRMSIASEAAAPSVLYSASTEIYDAVVSPFYSEELSLLLKGNNAVRIEEGSVTVPVGEQTTVHKDQVIHFDYGPHPKTFICATPHTVKLCDYRSKSSALLSRPVYDSPHWSDMIHALRFAQQPFTYAVSQDEHVSVYDLRKPATPLHRVLHCFPENPPNMIVVSPSSGAVNSYKFAAENPGGLQSVPSGMGSCSSDILLAYNDSVPSYIVAMAFDNNSLLSQYSHLAPHRATAESLVEKCKAEVFCESYRSRSAWNRTPLPTLVFSPSTVTEYSKVRGCQPVELGNGCCLVFQTDNIGTLSVEAFARDSHGLKRMQVGGGKSVDEVTDTLRRHYVWKYRRSSSEEKTKKDFYVSGRRKELFEEVDVRSRAERAIGKAAKYMEKQKQITETLGTDASDVAVRPIEIPRAPAPVEPPAKSYHKGGFVTEGFVEFLKHDWDT